MRRSTAIRKRKQQKNNNGGDAAQTIQTTETITRAKSAFIANISHEIRTPMNAILGFAQMLKASKLDPQQSDYVDVILDSGKKLLIIISNLLDLTNLQLGKTTLNPRPCKLNELINKLWQHFRPLIAARNLKPILECPSDLPELVLDCEKLERVLGYIISNAIKYTHTGFISLIVSIKAINHDCPRLAIEVADSGIGISEDKLSHIFEVFEQADSSITRPYSGMGIGLGLSKQIIVLMGGEIKVHSELGKGSRFFIEIPAKYAIGKA